MAPGQRARPGFVRHPVAAELVELDHNIYRATAATPTPALDTAFRRLSLSADHGIVWFAVAGALAVGGGARGRRAALDGVASLLVTSVVVNLGMKPLLPRQRPDRDEHRVVVSRHVPLPRSTSFPSGHASSGFAFASGAGPHVPELALPMNVLAALVAWSRVHTGVHYPGDVVTGSIVGAALGSIVSSITRRRGSGAPPTGPEE